MVGGWMDMTVSETKGYNVMGKKVSHANTFQLLSSGEELPHGGQPAFGHSIPCSKASLAAAWSPPASRHTSSKHLEGPRGLTLRTSAGTFQHPMLCTLRHKHEYAASHHNERTMLSSSMIFLTWIHRKNYCPVLTRRDVSAGSPASAPPRNGYLDTLV